MKLHILFIITIFNNLLCYSQTYNIYDVYFVPKREGENIKKTIEKSFSGWKTVSLFNQEGFLLQQTNYSRGVKCSDYKYEYTANDSLIKIKKTNELDSSTIFTLYYYYFNRQNMFYRHEIFFSSRSLDTPFTWDDNFVYNNEQLISYERHHIVSYNNELKFSSKYVYTYDINKQVERTYKIYGDSLVSNGCKSTTLFQNGKTTDIIHECQEGSFLGVKVWDNKFNKFHVRFSNFDKRGNWTRSYFITRKGKRFRSKRKIEYW
jgi:hypothetical protein